MRTTALIAAVVGSTAAIVLLQRAATPAPYDGPVALAAASPAPTPDWTLVLRDLDAARAAAFADPGGADPRAWADERCACHAIDRSSLASLVAADRALRVRPAVITGVRATGSAGEVTVTFADELPAYDEVDANGRVHRRWPARGPTRWRGVLVRTANGWRWRDLARVADDHDPAHGVDPLGAG